MNKTSSSKHYEQIISILIELKQLFPKYNLGRHLETALDEYKDVWGMTDKEFLYAISKYKAQLTIDVPHIKESSEIESIIKDAMNLDMMFQEDEEDNGSY